MIREDLNRETFYVETEKMVAKKKFNAEFSEDKDDCEKSVNTANLSAVNSSDSRIGATTTILKQKR